MCKDERGTTRYKYVWSEFFKVNIFILLQPFNLKSKIQNLK